MHRFKKLPLYLGLGVFVLAVLVSAGSLSEKNNLTNTQSRATNAAGNLTLRFSPPNLINVSLASDKPVVGIDVAIKYDPQKLTILPSSLKAGSSFTTTGGVIDDMASTFSFSALPKAENIANGSVATFVVEPKGISLTDTADLEFDTTDGNTAVIEGATQTNILMKAQGVQFTFTQ